MKTGFVALAALIFAFISLVIIGLMYGRVANKAVTSQVRPAGTTVVSRLPSQSGTSSDSSIVQSEAKGYLLGVHASSSLQPLGSVSKTPAAVKPIE